jgi:hypothetical protein
MSSYRLKGEDPNERNTNKLRSTALGLYLQMLPGEEERVSFYNRIAASHVKLGLLDAEVLNGANEMNKNNISFTNEELEFMNVSRYDGQRAVRITNYLDNMDLTKDQTDKMLNAYISAGFIDKKTNSTIYQWYTNKYGVQ